MSNNIIDIAKNIFNDEISAIKQVQSNLDEEFVKVVHLIHNCLGKVILTGIGKSGHIARKISATLASTGTPSFFVHPAEARHGDLGMIEFNDILIAISYSGESDELTTILPILKRHKVPIVGITGQVPSSLSLISDYVLNIKIDKEACLLGLAPTSSTTVTMVLGDALAVCVYNLRGFKQQDFALSHPGGTLGRKLLTYVEDIMHTEERLPKTLYSSSIKDVLVEISKKSLGFVGVVDENENILGIITDGDLRRLLEKKIDIFSVKVIDVMNRNPYTLKQGDLAIKAIDIMEKNKINGFLVEHKCKLVGAFNIHDLFAAKLL